MWRTGRQPVVDLLKGLGKEDSHEQTRAIMRAIKFRFHNYLESGASPATVMKFLRRVIALTVLFVLLAATSSCSPKLSSNNVARIKNGMTTAEVKAILGVPSQTESQSVSGISGTTYVYRKGQSEIKIVFFNDRVTAVQSHFP